MVWVFNALLLSSLQKDAVYTVSEPLFPTLGVREKRLGSRVTSIGMGCEVNGGPVMSSNP